MPRNDLLLPSFNIFTYYYLLFTKSPSYELQECLRKVHFSLEFFQLHPSFVLFWNEWFVWIHIILVWNGKTLLLSFCDFIFPCHFPITWLLRSCHLGYSLFLRSNDLLPPLHVSFCCYICRTTLYKVLSLITCCMNSWRLSYSTRAWLLLLLTRKRLFLIAHSWCHMSLPFLSPSPTCFKIS